MAKKMKKVLALLLAMSMVFSLLGVSAFAAEWGTNVFSDVAGNEWFSDAVKYVYENELMVGVGNGTFAPNSNVNRAMVVSVLYRMEENAEKYDTPSSFSDVEADAWYADAVIWAEKNKIASGYEDDTFRPTQPVSREELVSFFYRWAQYKERSDVKATSDMKSFTDAASVQSYAKTAMSWAVGTGLVNGVKKNVLDPAGTASRAQLAMILYRLREETIIAGDPNPPLIETPDIGGGGGGETPVTPHTHSYTNGTWELTTDGTQHTRTNTCSCGATTTETADHDYKNGECVCGAIQAPGITAGAVEALNTELAKITGNGDKPLVTVTQTDDKVSAVLDTDAIMGSGSSFSDEQLSGLMTSIKAALDETFGDYTLTVAGEEVYSNKVFNNTELKEALFSVADGFFYTLANMEAPDGVYTYKNVKAVVTNTSNSTDTYSFDLDVQLKGEDVSKVQKMAGILADHLSMTKMTADKVQSEYGVTVSGENEFIVVGMEMPEKIMSTLEQVLKENGKGFTTEEITEYFNNVPVGTILNVMGMATVDNLVGSGASEVGTLVNMVNSNANLINKVMGKLTIKTGETKLFEGPFTPGNQEDAWQKAMDGVIGMMTEGGKTLTPGQFIATNMKDHYLVPITVDIDLDSSMGFKASETVLFDLHIPLSKLGGTTEPEPPEEKTDEQVTKDAVAEVQKVLEGFKGHGGKQLVTLTETDGGYDLNLDVSAVIAGGEITDGAGLATALGNAMKETFDGRTLSVNGKTVYSADGTFNNTELKDALFDVAGGFFYHLSTMEGDTYKTVKAAVGDYTFDVNVKLSGDDVARVKELAGKLEKYLSMAKMDASEVAEKYDYTEGDESEYIVIGVEMPQAAKDALVQLKPNVESFENASVMNALTVLAGINVPGMLGDNAANIDPMIATVNAHADLVNTVLRHATITVAGQELGTTFTPGTNEGSEWQNFMVGVLGMVNGCEFGTIGDYAVNGQNGLYVVPVTVDIDLASSLGFTANETVLVVLNIPFPETTEAAE